MKATIQWAGKMSFEGRAQSGHSVMMDGSLMEDAKTPASFEYNAKVSKHVVDIAHAIGVSVEGELGCLGSLESGHGEAEDGHGAEGVLSHDQLLTDPNEAAEFVKATQVDALAIAIGTSHGAYKFTKPPTGDTLAIGRIKEINFDVGSRVNKGQVILRIDERETAQALAGSNAQVLQAQATLARRAQFAWLRAAGLERGDAAPPLRIPAALRQRLLADADADPRLVGIGAGEFECAGAGLGQAAATRDHTPDRHRARLIVLAPILRRGVAVSGDPASVNENSCPARAERRRSGEMKRGQ